VKEIEQKNRSIPTIAAPIATGIPRPSRVVNFLTILFLPLRARSHFVGDINGRELQTPGVLIATKEVVISNCYVEQVVSADAR
jgi:hypothetical protein